MVTESTLFKPKLIGGFAQRGHRRPKTWRKRLKLPLTIKQILAWADAHYERTGKWPQAKLRQVYDAPSETWIAVNCALSLGYRGLPGGSSLAKLLAERRGVRNSSALPRMSVKQILVWADAHYERTGKWPKAMSGRVHDASSETWGSVDSALRSGYRGLPGGHSLPRLLAERRGVRNSRALPRLSIKQILTWADNHRERTGKWPHLESGRIHDAPLSETWGTVDVALRTGNRGLSGSTSLAWLLVERRGMRSQIAMPKLTIQQILAWADAHYERTGKWPNLESGAVHGEPSETWNAISVALHGGYRGLHGGCTLTQLLMKRRGIRSRIALPKLTVRKVMAWADAYHKRTGAWPDSKSGPIEGSGGETWLIIDRALSLGQRGLPGGSSLRRFLHEHRRVPHRLIRPRLTTGMVLKWADAHHRRTGRWPACKSGHVCGTRDEKWYCIDNALRQGGRGFPGGLSLHLLLAKHRGSKANSRLPATAVGCRRRLVSSRRF